MFFLTYILQYIFSLSKKTKIKKTKTHTHTCPIFVCDFSWQQIGDDRTGCVKKNHMMLVLLNVEKSQNDSLVDV